MAEENTKNISAEESSNQNHDPKRNGGGIKNSKTSWIISKKDYKRNDAGKFILIGYSKDRKHGKWNIQGKDIVDFSFRLIGLLAIAIPIVLFLLQQREKRIEDDIKSEKEERKQMYQLQVNLLDRFLALKYMEPSTKEFREASNLIETNIYASIKMLEDPDLEREYTRILDYKHCLSLLYQSDTTNYSVYLSTLSPIMQLAQSHLLIKGFHWQAITNEKTLKFDTLFYLEKKKVLKRYSASIFFLSKNMQDLSIKYEGDTSTVEYKTFNLASSYVSQAKYIYERVSELIQRYTENIRTYPKSKERVQENLEDLFKYTYDLHDLIVNANKTTNDLRNKLSAKADTINSLLKEFIHTKYSAEITRSKRFETLQSETAIKK
jgi:hypothetical protein